MAMHGNENVAKRVVQGRVAVTAGAWVLLAADGSTNLKDRTHVRIQTKGKVGNAISLAYVNGTTTDGQTFTFDATTIPNTHKYSTQFRGTATWVEPVGHGVNIYGRLDNKAGATEGSLTVIVTEFA